MDEMRQRQTRKLMVEKANSKLSAKLIRMLVSDALYY